MRLCVSGGPSIEMAIESIPASTSSRAYGSRRPPLVMTVQVSPRFLISRTSGRMSGYSNGSPPKRETIGRQAAISSNSFT